MIPNNTVSPKPRSKKHVILRLARYIFAHKWMVLGAVSLTIASNLLALLGPALSGYAIDAIGTEAGMADFNQVYFYCFLMLVFYVVSSALTYVLSILMTKLSQRISYQMRKDLVDKLLELPVRFFDGHQTGDIISRLSYDIDTITASLSNDLLQIAASAITVFGSFFMMLAISPVLILVFAFTIPASVLFIIYRTKKVRPLFRKRSAKLGELNGFVEEIISGQKTTKAYHQEETMVGRFDVKNNEAVDAYYMADYYGSTVGPSVNFINNISLTLISIFGSLLYLVGSVSLGNLSSFVLYSRRFSGPINEMANIISELQSAASAAERVFRLIDEQPESADLPQATALADVKGDVQMQDIQFGYDPEKIIIHDLNLHARPGSLVAIVGPTGAGKTTIINLLMRFYDPQKGHILMEGRDSMDITRRSLRAAYTMVLQDTWLFYGTIYDNIRLQPPGRDPRGGHRRGQGSQDPQLHHGPAGRLRHHRQRRRTEHLAGTKADADHRARHALRRQDADSRRGDLQRRHPHRAADSGGDARPDEGQNLLCHCPPALHRAECGHHPGGPAWRHHRAGQPRRADAEGRRLCRTVHLAV